MISFLDTGKKVVDKATGGNWFIARENVIPRWEISVSGIDLPFGYVLKRNGQSTVEHEANARLMACANSMAQALQTIADMQITETTNPSEVLSLCMSIARIELEKLTRCHK